MSTNIYGGRCQYDCASTWRYEHGGSLPGGPFPGTGGRAGDVRRCEHGNVWIFSEVRESRYYTKHDIWRRLNPLWDRREYRRALAALSADVWEPCHWGAA